MNKILKRDEYIKEVYDPMMEEKRYEELKVINEGLLKTLFGMAKNLFKQDWASIKGNTNIIKIYKEIDDRLSGFSVMKLSKKDECNQIRQELVDFACDWYEMKMNHAKDKDEDPKPAKSMKFKDETLKSNFETTQNKIKSIANGDEQMIKWAQLLMDSMKSVINRSILNDIKNEETKKEIEKQFEEDLKNPEKVSKMLEDWQNKVLTQVQKDREKLISDAGATPIQEGLLGDKAIQNLCGEFDKIRKTKKAEDKLNLFKKDSTFGFKSIFNEDDYQNKAFKTTYKLMDSFYTKLKDEKEFNFNDTPGQSVQSMCIAVNSFIKNCVYGSEDYGNELNMMAKCAILSNGLVNYKLPLNKVAIDKGLDDEAAGNYFTDTISGIINGEFKDAKGNDIKLPDDFKQNADALFNKIKSAAKKIKEKSDKDYDAQLKMLKLDKKEK